MLYRLIRGVNGTDAKYTVFGLNQHSAPSYIPAENFASSVIDTLEIPTLVDNLTASRLEKFRDQRLADIKGIISNLEQEIDIDGSLRILIEDANTKLTALEAEFQNIIENFAQNKSDLESSVNLMAVSFNNYIESLQLRQMTGEVTTKTVSNLQNLQQNLFNNTEKAIVSGGMRPNLNEVAQIMNTTSSVYHELTSFLERKNSPAYERVRQTLSALPPSWSDNIITLAKGTQTRVDSAEEGVTALRRKLESAFDKSMDRASGVYKRNAKGVAILIGIILAISTNTDAFHMTSRFSKDSALRQTITQNAYDIVVKANENNNQTSQGRVNLDTLKESTEKALADISLPVGWTENNIQQQFLSIDKDAGNSSDEKPLISISERRSNNFNTIGGFKSRLGWIVSGVAISMGAPFWFYLVNKITNARNTGKLPNSTTNRNPDSYYDIENLNNERR